MWHWAAPRVARAFRRRTNYAQRESTRRRVGSRFRTGRFHRAALPDRGSRRDRSRASLAWAGFRACAPRSILGINHGDQAGDGQCIAIYPKTTYDGPRRLRDIRAPAEWLACMDVADVYLDDRRVHGDERVKDRYGGVGVSGRIDDK